MRASLSACQVWTIDQACIFIDTLDYSAATLGESYIAHLALMEWAGRRAPPVQHCGELTPTQFLSVAISNGLPLSGIYPGEEFQREFERQKVVVNRIMPTPEGELELQVLTGTGWRRIDGVRVSSADVMAAISAPQIVSSTGEGSGESEEVSTDASAPAEVTTTEAISSVSSPVCEKTLPEQIDRPRRIKEADAIDAYKDRKDNWPIDKPFPSRQEDEKWGRGRGFKRAWIREIRREYTKPGRRKVTKNLPS